MPNIDHSSSLKFRVMDRINARLPPPPTDWVEPEPQPLQEGEVGFRSLDKTAISDAANAPGIIGLPGMRNYQTYPG